ncbi:MAG: hypothetical protein ABL880_02020 [Methylotenera sp.]
MKQLSYKYYFWLLIGGIVIYLCQDITSADKIYVSGVFFLLWMVFAPLVIMIMLFRYWPFYLVVSISAFVLFSQFAEGGLAFFAAYAGVMLGIFIKHFFPEAKLAQGSALWA